MSLFPLSILKISQFHHLSNSMNASLSSSARGKRILIDQVDRISKLPDDVLVMILTNMSTEDAVKTGLLSKRWKSVWKQVPYLNFDMLIPSMTKIILGPLAPHSDHVAESITKVINNHNGHLEGCSIHHYAQQCQDGVLESWIRLLTREKHTKALALSNLHVTMKGSNLLQLSPNTFSHPQLATLYLHHYVLETPHAFNHCHNLKILKLVNIFAEVDVFNTVIASCPSLKVLVLQQVMWYNEKACLKIHNNNLKLLHVASFHVDCIEVSAALLDIFSINNMFYGVYNFVIKAPRLLFNELYGAINVRPIMSYNISCDAREIENLEHKFLVSRDVDYLQQLKCLAVAVDVMNSKEVEMLRQLLLAWNGIMRKLDIFFKHNNVSKEEGESSIGGTQNKKWEDQENLFPNAHFRVEAVRMFNFSGSNEKQFALASSFITQGIVMKRMMIKTSSICANEKLEIEAAVAKLMKLPKGNEKLRIGYF